MRATVKGVLAAAMAAAFLVGAGSSASPSALGQASPSKQETQAGVPQTADEHTARAAWYREKAASYRQEAELHRRMFADYDKKEGSAALRSKSGRELPWVAKMRKHCEGYMEQAQKMATEADRFAEFHRMRAEEMQGQ